MIKLEKIIISEYIPNKWANKSVWDSFDRLKSFLESRTSELGKYKNVLAYPAISRNFVEWKTNEFTCKPKRLTELSQDEQVKYRTILDEFFSIYNNLANSLNNKKETSEWASLFEKIILCPSENNVFCAEDKIVITCWGSTKKGVSDDSIFQIKFNPKKGAFEKPRISKQNPTDVPAKESSGESIISPLDEQKNQTQDENNLKDAEPWQNRDNTESQAEPKEHSVEKPIDRPTESSTEDNNIDNPPEEPLNLDDIPVYEPIEDYSEEQQNTQAEEEQNAGKEQKEEKRKRKRKRQFPSWLKILLLILLLLFLLLALKHCFGGGNKTPKKPGQYLPVDSVDIGISDDSLLTVVTNRLNILIKNEGMVKEFMKDFKKEYSGKKYQIVYFDTLIQRVQIKFPKEEKEQLRKEIPNKLKKYDLLIWDESVFKNFRKPNDPAFENTKLSWYFDCIKAYGAWDKTTGSDSIIVAIIDDGFDLDHPELQGKVVKPYNYASRNKKISYLKPEIGVHGTHVASTAIGTADNNQGASGIAPKCRLMPIQVADPSVPIMTTTNVMDAVLYAIFQGANVINLSLGKEFSPLLQLLDIGMQMSLIQTIGKEEEKVWNEIFALAEAHHCTVVIAGGNENILVGLDPMQRSSYTIKVSAIQPDLKKANFSNYGYYSTISAPGVKIFNAVPEREYDMLDGTSMAAPIVAGAVALIKSVQPNLTTGQIAQLMRRTGIKSPSYVGPILQLDKALGVVGNPESGELPDPNIGQPPKEPLHPGTPDYPGGPIERPSPIDPNNPNDPDDPEFPITPKPELPPSPCEDIQKEIDELQKRIDELKKECEQIEGDTLKFKPSISLNDIAGIWKSTTNLYSDSGKKIELYFRINRDGTGTINYFEERKNEFNAPIQVEIDDEKLMINQLKVATGEIKNRGFATHYFMCTPDPVTRVALGEAYLKRHPNIKLVNFKLIKIK